MNPAFMATIVTAEADLVAFGRRVTEARTTASMSKEEAGRRAGISSITWKRVEDGLPVQDAKLGQVVRVLLDDMEVGSKATLGLAVQPQCVATGSIYDEIRAERQRAHAKHGATSMELTPVDEMYRAVILGEEIGEVAEITWLAWSAALTAKFSYVQKVMNDGRHDGITDTAKLRKELVQVATMAAAWADRIPADDPASAAPTPVPQAVAGTVEPAAPATRTDTGGAA